MLTLREHAQCIRAAHISNMLTRGVPRVNMAPGNMLTRGVPRVNMAPGSPAEYRV